MSRRSLLLLLPAGIAAAFLLPRLSAEEVMLAALCRGLFFLDGDPRPEDLRTGRIAAAQIAALPAMTRWQLRGDLRRLELAVALLTGSRLSKASSDEVRLALQHLRTRDSGPALARLQEVCALACYGHPSVQAEIGYEGPPP